VATNVALSHLKTARRQAPLPECVPDGRGGAAPPDPAVRDAIRCAFRRLPAKLLAVATLALLEERPYAEVADALSISVAAVKSREFRAVRILRKELQRLGVEP
jgi:DNA-directed RNA polymerase specialized sigma24 family protein